MGLDLTPKDQRIVLVVDNDEGIQRLLQGILVDMGFETRTTWSGYEALALLESRPVDVLLVDDYVADLHVDDFLERVGRSPIQPRTVVMQAARLTSQHVRKYALLGASTVIRKYHLGELCRAVAPCWYQRNQTRSNVSIGRIM